MRVYEFLYEDVKIGKAKVASTVKRAVTSPDNVLKTKIKKESQDNTTTETDSQLEITETEKKGMKNKDTTDKIDTEKVIMTGGIEMTERTDTEDNDGEGKFYAAILNNTNVGQEILAPNRDQTQEIVNATTEVILQDVTVTTTSEEEIVAMVVEISTTDVEGVTLHAQVHKDDRFDGNVNGFGHGFDCRVVWVVLVDDGFNW